MASEQINFKELLELKNVSSDTLARLLGVHPRKFRRAVTLEGRATPQEIDRIAQILGVFDREVEAALAETARRPGERDVRGRKKQTVGDSNNVDAAVRSGDTGDGTLPALPADGRDGSVATNAGAGVHSARNADGDQQLRAG